MSEPDDFEAPVYEDNERPEGMNPPAHEDAGDNPGAEDA